MMLILHQEWLHQSLGGEHISFKEGQKGPPLIKTCLTQKAATVVTLYNVPLI